MKVIYPIYVMILDTLYVCMYISEDCDPSA